MESAGNADREFRKAMLQENEVWQMGEKNCKKNYSGSKRASGIPT